METGVRGHITAVLARLQSDADYVAGEDSPAILACQLGLWLSYDGRSPGLYGRTIVFDADATAATRARQIATAIATYVLRCERMPLDCDVIEFATDALLHGDVRQSVPAAPADAAVASRLAVS